MSCRLTMGWKNNLEDNFHLVHPEFNTVWSVSYVLLETCRKPTGHGRFYQNTPVHLVCFAGNPPRWASVGSTLYRISSYSFCGNYSFLTLALCIMYCDLWSQYINVRKLFKGRNYMRKYGIYFLIISLRTHKPQLPSHFWHIIFQL